MRGPLRGVCREMRGGAAEEIPQPFCKVFLLAFAFPHHQNVPAIALQAISLTPGLNNSLTTVPFSCNPE